MAVTRGELKGKILRVLYKSARFTGAYDPQTIDDAIDEAMDAVASEMFTADEGWQKKIMYLDTVPGQISIDLPVSAALISQVRYQFANEYILLGYDQQWEQGQWVPNSGMTQWPNSYSVIDNALYFSPALAEGGAAYLQLTVQSWPKRLRDDSDYFESQYDNSMMNFMKYKAASMLVAGIEKNVVPWAQQEAFWYQAFKNIVITRNQQSQPIREFTGW